MRNPHKDCVEPVPVLIKRAMLMVTKNDIAFLKRLCRDVFHKVKLGMSPKHIEEIVCERHRTALSRGQRFYRPALVAAARLSLQRQEVLAKAESDEMNQVKGDKLNELLGLIGVVPGSPMADQICLKIDQLVGVSQLVAVSKPNDNGFTIKVSDFSSDSVQKLARALEAEDWDTQPGVGVTTSQALKTTPRASVSTLIKSLQCLQRGWNGNVEQANALSTKHAVEISTLREERDATERRVLLLQNTIDKVCDVIDNHAASDISHAASTWVRVLDQVATAKRVNR